RDCQIAVDAKPPIRESFGKVVRGSENAREASRLSPIDDPFHAIAARGAGQRGTVVSLLTCPRQCAACSHKTADEREFHGTWIENGLHAALSDFIAQFAMYGIESRIEHDSIEACGRPTCEEGK